LELHDLQKHASIIAKERGHSNNTREELLFRLAFETNEVIEAVLVKHGLIKVHEGAKVGKVSHELGDMLQMILRVSEMEGIDLEAAYLEKMELDKTKVYA
jgi:NTP pyrophosphatase (non-canonical NTP hydrolase)